jgi:hypothetical protein
VGLVGADLADLRNLVVQLGGPMRANFDDVLTRTNQAVQSSSTYWVAANADQFRTDFANFVSSTQTRLDCILQEAARVTGQRLGAIQQATESNALAPYWEPSNLFLPRWSNLIPNSESRITSNEEGALYYGSAGYLFAHYGIGHRIMLPESPETPWPVVPRTEDLPTPEIQKFGQGWVDNTHGILVPAGSQFDPNAKLPPDELGAGWKTGVGAGLRPEPVNVPEWADYGSKGLFVVGAGLTLYGAWDQAWENDQALHPNWSTSERIADAAGQTVVIGGSSVAGGWAGAELGAEGGIEIGGLIGSIFPGPGTVIGGVVGGLIGGIAGGFVGSQLGQAVGEGLWDAGKSVGHGLEDVGKDVGNFIGSIF